MSIDNTSTIIRSAKIFLSGTFLSRFTGMLRDMSMAYSFGAHPAIAAFMVAFRFSYLFRRLFGESALSSSFIPHFEKTRQASPENGAKLFRDLSFTLILFLSSLVALCEGGLFYWLKWGGASPDTQEIIVLSMCMLPGVLFICLFALNAALLQCEKKFFLPSAAPAIFNIIWIGAVILLNTKHPQYAVVWLSCVVTFAFFAQWVATLSQSWKFLKNYLSLKECFTIRIRSPELKSLLASFSLTVLGIGAVQINSALDALFARSASLEGPAYLWYAIRLEQLPLALFGIALSSALLPPLSRAIQSNDLSKYNTLLSYSLRKGFSLMLPCTIGIFVLGASSVNLLYGRGDFTVDAVSQTVLCLWGYALSLVPSCFVLLFAPAFYARKEYFLPTMASIISVVCNCLLNALFVFGLGWGAFSIALATSVAAFLNALLLGYFLSKKVGSFFPKETVQSFVKTTLCALLSGGMTLLLGHFLIQDPSLYLVLGNTDVAFSQGVFLQLLHFFVLSGVYGLLFFSYAWLFKLEDILALIGLGKTKETPVSL